MTILDGVDFQDPELTERLLSVRRDLHAHPELGFHEVRTAGVIAARLRELEIPVTEGVASTGVVGLIEGGKPGPTVLLRADMDALPLHETNDVEYRSTVKGSMHACGHDAHVSILLGAAEILQARRADLAGSVKLCFQPAEEGPGGALPMIEQGVLEEPKVHYALGLHVWTNLPRGEIGILPGPTMAAADTFDCTITARGGHGAAPHQTPDPIITACSVISSWQAILARECDPLKPAVLSVCQIEGGTTYNVIPHEVSLKGTVRTFDDKVREQIPEAMERMLGAVADGYGCDYRFEWRSQYPSTINDPAMAAEMKAVVGEMGDHLVTSANSRPCMGAEDMSYFLREVPGCFVFLGAARPDNEDPPPHHCDRFDIDEGCMNHGVEFMVRGALRMLSLGIPEA